MKNVILSITLLTASMIAMKAESSIHQIPVNTLEGAATNLGTHKGKVMLVVNVASRCGYTPQYKDLEALYQKFKDQGLVVCGFPCNQFGRQEPGTATEIREFCTLNYGVTFPMYEKIDVKGPDQHPVYELLSGEKSAFPGDVRWNFGKFLVGKDGTVLKRFGSGTAPLSEELVGAVKKALH